MGANRVIDLVTRDDEMVAAARGWLAGANAMLSSGHPLPALPETLIALSSLESLAVLSARRAQVVKDLIAAGHADVVCDRLWDVLVWQLAAASESDLRDELEAMARTDPLTGLLNRRGLAEALEREAARARRHGTTVSLVLLDLDRFKALNDTYGHGAGDKALRAIGELLRRGLRTGDEAGRWGGDEFAAILAGTDDVRALEVVDRLRSAVIHPSSRRTALSGVSFSAGVAALSGAEAMPERLMELADAALYRAKGDGGNCARRHV